jgi:hypothetical protein
MCHVLLFLPIKKRVRYISENYNEGNIRDIQ